LKKFPKTKLLFSVGYLNKYTNAIKAGVAGYVHKQEKLETLGQSIIKVNQGKIIMNEDC
jgi:DNA-binding NarL/FixJ family response regulator